MTVNPYAPSGFWLKAKLFINRSLESANSSSEDERRIWAALGLELLAKWALAETSPTLVIDPVTDGGSNLLRALDLQDGAKNVTAPAKTIFSRCAQIFRPFDEKAAGKIAGTRNDYLHGAGVEILTLPGHAWWPKYWSLVNVLLTSQQCSLEELVGFAELHNVNKQLELHTHRIEDQYEVAFQTAQRNLKKFKEGNMSAREKSRWDSLLRKNPELSYRAQVDCPVCSAIGEVQSDYAEAKEIAWWTDSDDPYQHSPYVEVTFEPDFYICPTCHLVLDDPQLLEYAGLDGPVTIGTDEDPYLEGEYGND